MGSWCDFFLSGGGWGCRQLRPQVNTVEHGAPRSSLVNERYLYIPQDWGRGGRRLGFGSGRVGNQITIAGSSCACTQNDRLGLGGLASKLQPDDKGASNWLILSSPGLSSIGSRHAAG